MRTFSNWLKDPFGSKKRRKKIRQLLSHISAYAEQDPQGFQDVVARLSARLFQTDEVYNYVYNLQNLRAANEGAPNSPGLVQRVSTLKRLKRDYQNAIANVLDEDERQDIQDMYEQDYARIKGEQK